MISITDNKMKYHRKRRNMKRKKTKSLLIIKRKHR